MIVPLYLAVIVAANVTIATYGPSAAIVVAAVFIGADLTLRDRLHDRWDGRSLVIRMAALIVAGGVLSWTLNASAGPVAVASTVAFVLSAAADAVVYASLHRRSWFLRANGSNLVGSGVDSLVFPTIAFGGFLPAVVVGQFVAKAVGGAAWAVVLRRWRA